MVRRFPAIIVCDGWRLALYASILAYLQRVGTRPAYLRAMAKGDPDLTPMLS
jgi:glutathione S-transferase